MRSPFRTVGSGILLAFVACNAMALGFGRDTHASNLGQPLDFMYQGHLRKVCPYLLAETKDTRIVLHAYQYSGGEAWKSTASYPPMLYPTHAVGGVLGAAVVFVFALGFQWIVWRSGGELYAAMAARSASPSLVGGGGGGAWRTINRSTQPPHRRQHRAARPQSQAVRAQGGRASPPDRSQLARDARDLGFCGRLEEPDFHRPPQGRLDEWQHGGIWL